MPKKRTFDLVCVNPANPNNDVAETGPAEVLLSEYPWLADPWKSVMDYLGDDQSLSIVVRNEATSESFSLTSPPVVEPKRGFHRVPCDAA